jgi:hypothetical protein
VSEVCVASIFRVEEIRERGKVLDGCQQTDYSSEALKRTLGWGGRLTYTLKMEATRSSETSGFKNPHSATSQKTLFFNLGIVIPDLWFVSSVVYSSQAVLFVNFISNTRNKVYIRNT